MNFVIAGGTGLIGRVLRSKLETAGHTDVVRSSGLPKDTNSIINLCGRSIGELNPLYLLPGPYKAYISEVFSSRIETNKLLIGASESLPLKIYISASATGFYRPEMKMKFTEEEKFVDCGLISRLAKDWEDAARLPNRQDVRQYQLRLGVVLSRESNFVRSLYPSHRIGLGGPMGSGQQWISWIHLEDAVRAIEFLLHLKEQGSVVRNGPVNLVAPNSYRQAIVSKAFGEALNAPKLPFAPFTTPSTVVKLLIGNERATILLDGQRVVPKILQDAGFEFHYPKLDDALYEIFGRRLSNPIPTD